MTATALNMDPLLALTRHLATEKAASEAKSRNRNCLQTQRELEISNSDREGIAILRRVFFGEYIGSLPCWKIKKDHEPISNSPENAAHVIKAMKIKLRLNTLKNQIQLNNQPINDFDVSRIQNEMKRWGLNSSGEHINAIIMELAAKNSFHPFKEFVESKPWDGHDHIADLFGTLTIQEEFADKSETYHLDLRRWFIGLIAKQYAPGAQNYLIVLQGKQGRQKDRWFQRLAPIEGIYSEGEVDPSNKDHKFIHRDNVIYNVAEIDATIRKKDASALKQFLTLKDLKEREPYGKYPVSFKSNCSFCGSVNDPQFLNDPTGSRRFHVIPIERAEAQHNVDVQQVFAQALALFKSGEQYWFDEQETALRDEDNSQFCVEDIVTIIASKIEPGEHPITCTELLKEYGIDRPTQAQVVKLGIQLTKNGIRKQPIKIKGSTLSHYFVMTRVDAMTAKVGIKK